MNMVIDKILNFVLDLVTKWDVPFALFIALSIPARVHSLLSISNKVPEI